jgi:GNAT superfamily N-acetyltransferase
LSRLFNHPKTCDAERLRFEPFRTDTSKVGSFDCGNKSLNDFLCSEEVNKYQKENFGRTTLVFCDGELAGYYTVAYGQLRREYLQKWKSFSKAAEARLENIPGLIIGRLAVSKEWQNMGIGRTTIQRIAMLALDHSEQSGLRLLLVQAKKEAFEFYQKLGFEFTTEVKKEKQRYKDRQTRTMYFDLSSLAYLKTYR